MMSGARQMTLMADAAKAVVAECDAHWRATEEAAYVARRAEGLRQQVRAAQRSAADSLDRSAVSQDRAARIYEQLADNRERGDEYSEHAARHRQFAREDRVMAQRLREMAESDSAGIT
jgi:urocanate hydratase